MTGMARVSRLGLEPPRRLPAVEHRQAHVHQDEVGPLRRRHARRPAAPSTAISDLVALAREPAREHVAVHLVVLDQQDLGHARFSCRRSRVADRLAGRRALARRCRLRSCRGRRRAARRGRRRPSGRLCSTCPFSQSTSSRVEVLGGHDDDRDVAPGRLAPHRLEHLEAVHPRHHQVEQDHRRPRRARARSSASRPFAASVTVQPSLLQRAAQHRRASSRSSSTTRTCGSPPSAPRCGRQHAEQPPRSIGLVRIVGGAERDSPSPGRRGS